MKAKHVAARIRQCLAIAECSTCPRRKLAAVLFDPVRNDDLGSGYNGPPRGADGDMCGGHRCLRDGLTPADVVICDSQGRNVEHDPLAERGAGIDDDDVIVTVKGGFIWRGPFDAAAAITPAAVARNEAPRMVFKEIAWIDRAYSHANAYRFWLDAAQALRTKLLADNPPIPSGTRIEIGCHHAEWNVIANAAARGTATAGAWLVVLAEPCLVCAKLLHHVGVAKVLCVQGGYAGGSAGVEYLRAHGVEVEFVEGPRDPRSATEGE